MYTHNMYMHIPLSASKNVFCLLSFPILNLNFKSLYLSIDILYLTHQCCYTFFLFKNIVSMTINFLKLQRDLESMIILLVCCYIWQHEISLLFVLHDSNLSGNVGLWLYLGKSSDMALICFRYFNMPTL